MTKNEVKDLKDAASPDPKSGLTTFFKDTKVEFDRVVWPSRQQLISESAAVLLMVVAAASLIYLVDGLFSWISKQVF
jgi:preprotein translocase subunit SecE